LFWGYSLQDAGTLQALSPDPSRSRDHADRWIVLKSPIEQDRAYFTALGFQIIIADSGEMLSYLQDIPAGRTSTRHVRRAPLLPTCFPKKRCLISGRFQSVRLRNSILDQLPSGWTCSRGKSIEHPISIPSETQSTLIGMSWLSEYRAAERPRS
jgi:hypothetical protein